MVKERKTEKELRQMMLAAAREHEECSELEDLFIFGPTPRRDANWGFGIAGKENKVSVACYARLDRLASELQQKYQLHPVKADRRDIEARFGPWSMTTRRSGRLYRAKGVHTKSLHSSDWRGGRTGQWNGLPTISRPERRLIASSGLFKRKSSWNNARASVRRRGPQVALRQNRNALLRTTGAG
ncbi:hypothetical protein [Bradyrhizobium sp. RDI18]|uniref:hypothetical protein n=1 Tax=Bradyrhizobium sp. RDI18 TaxID=3367400 RepID=UPI00371EA1FA